MNTRKLVTLLSAGLLAAATVCVQAQQGPGGQATRGGAMRGGMGMGGFSFSQGPVGPPAPVLAEVAIPRPTQAEVDRMNAELKKLVDASAEKELFKKYDSLLTIQIPRTNTAVCPVQTMVRTTQRHNGFVELAKTNDFDILFEGDSITDFWQTTGEQGGAEVFPKYFGGLKVANFAVSGDTTQGVLWGLKHGEGQGHKPKAIMLMIGTNNGLQGNTGPEIAEGIGAIVYQFRQDFPDARILLLAIFPRGTGASDSLRQKNEEANKLIAKLDDGKHVFFKNINDKFLNTDGSLIGFRADNLHPNAKGYEIWGEAVAATLKSWVN